MAKKTAKKTSKKAGRKAAGPKPDFHRQMVLSRWAFGRLGVANLQEFKDRFQLGPDAEGGLDPRTGNHRFYEAIANALPGRADVLTPDRLLAYEQNILEHTATINKTRAARQGLLEWKYHQHLALLLTEIYLDHYFRDPGALRDEINTVIEAHNEPLDPDSGDRVDPFPTNTPAREDLARLAYWCATGSGKTLLMHAHIHQFRWYQKRAYEGGTWPKLDQILLIAPNPGLGRQHAQEFRDSGLDAVEVGEDGVEGLFASHAKSAIKILPISKILTSKEVQQRREGGKKFETQGLIAEEAEGCNLVLVDEGHRGAGSGEEGKWVERRDQLAKGGFCFEYSATFKEAVKGEEGMRHRYARSILLDYAYRSFYRDGYGKDFMILNLEDDHKQDPYLTAATLLFYQQMRVWLDGSEKIKPFLIDKPLWVFVGHTVTGKSASTTDDREVLSDVVTVLAFFKRLLSDRKNFVALIKSILKDGFLDQSGRSILENRLTQIDTSGNKDALAEQIYAGIMRDIFRAPPEGGALGVQMLRGADGELALKVGEGDPFGVVNVGDPAGVAAACKDQKIAVLEDDHNRPSLFDRINRDDSPVNLLVGSRKFTEGWNSWRVSSIGLMRMGRSEGTQIIQLFGRGVRLRGHRMSLRRSSVLVNLPDKPNGLRQVETLQVFGVKADYMATFKDWIYSEVPEAEDRQIWDLPTIKSLPPGRKLKTLRLREEIEGEKIERGQAFRRLGPLVRLRPPDPVNPTDEWLRQSPVRANWMPRIQGLVGANRDVTTDFTEATELPVQKFGPLHLAMLDYQDLHFGLETYKAAHSLDRVWSSPEAIRTLFQTPDWYTLHATDQDMDTARYENRSQWQRMAQQLLNAYAQRLYNSIRQAWEAPYIEIGEVDESDLLDSYTIETNDRSTPDGIEEVATFVTDLSKALKKNATAAWSHFQGNWRTVPFPGHLYQPLLHLGKGQIISISPIALDKYEATFVEDLQKWCAANKGVEVFLLRNQSKTGLGFFQAANFYPDFLMWVLKDGQEHLVFVDPKGLKHHDKSDPKIRFATQVIPRLQTIIDRNPTGLALSAFIVSNTPYASLNWSKDDGSRMTKAEIESLGILFQTDDASTYIASMMSETIRSPQPSS